MKSINYRLAKAMGWGVDSHGVSNMIWNDEWVMCRTEENVWCKFDYRDPVIFAAIVKRYRLHIAPRDKGKWEAWQDKYWSTRTISGIKDTPELAAALAVIAKEKT